MEMIADLSVFVHLLQYVRILDDKRLNANTIPKKHFCNLTHMAPTCHFHPTARKNVRSFQAQHRVERLAPVPWVFDIEMKDSWEEDKRNDGERRGGNGEGSSVDEGGRPKKKLRTRGT